MQKMILGFILTIVVLISGCVGPIPEKIQETEHIQETWQINETTQVNKTTQVPSGEISYTGIDVKNLTGSVPVILSIRPNAGTVGTKIVITGRGFTAEHNNIAFRLKPDNSSDDFKIGYETSIKSRDGKTIEFDLPGMLGACAYIPKRNTTCVLIGLLLNPGTTYPLFIVNMNGKSNSVSFTMK